MQQNKRGFTLIELSAALVIIGMLVAANFSANHFRDKNLKSQLTKAKMEDIIKAIEGFAMLNNRLPCPSDITASTGTESCSGTLSAGSGAYIGGGIPVSALMLDSRYAYDDWGRKIVYAVVASFTTSNALSSDISYTGFTIRDIAGSNRTTASVFLLLSTGANGHGGWSRTGVRLSNGSDSNENNNLPSNLATWDSIHVQDSPIRNSSGTYDDILLYRTRYGLLNDLGVLFIGTVCTTANNALGSGASSALTLCNPGLTNCYDFFTQLAQAVKQRCLMTYY